MTPDLTFQQKNPFRSFWMGGFECSDKMNAFGNRVDLLSSTGHIDRIDEDYENLKLLNISTVREGIRWSQVERRPYDYDWSCLSNMVRSGIDHRVQQVWDICHFGFPDDLTPLHPMFARRFAAACRSFVRAYREIDPDNELIVTPINEVGFLSWLGGEAKGTSPYCTGHGWQVKYELMRAYIEGLQALKEEDPRIRILTTEPLVHVTYPGGASEEHQAAARQHHEYQYQVTDILIGKMSPELGGQPEYLDILGVNFYFNNQWVIEPYESLDWRTSATDSRWKPLSNMLKEVYDRYQRPIVISETSHCLEERPQWMEAVSRECAVIFEMGIPLWGLCWYPLIDRPDWDHLHDWHRSGIWDRLDNDDERIEMVLHDPSAQAFLAAQAMLEKHTGAYLTA